MRGLRICSLAVVCTFGLIGNAAMAAKAPAATSSTSADARNKALLGFQHDLISVLSPSGEAQSLLAAALLARPLPDANAVNSFHKLIGRANAADGAGPAQRWLQMADCDAGADACPNQAALAKLTTETGDNAAVWLLKLGQDTRNSQSKAVREDLRRAAAAKLYDDYTGASLKALANGVTVLPPPPATLDPNSAAGAAGLQTVIVYGVASSQPQPALQITAQFCDQGKTDASIKADCLALGKTLEWGSSPLARSLGLHLREQLADDETVKEDAKRARRSLTWEVQNFAQLQARAQNDKALAQHLLSLARSGGTEMSILLAALRDYGISPDAPVDWAPGAAGKS